MADKNKINRDMLAYCGLYCELCSFKTAFETGEQGHLDAVPYPFESDPLSEYDCSGCKGDRCICGPCKIQSCAKEREIESCADCTEFPCEETIRFQTDHMPHHWEAVKNLYAIKEHGINHWFSTMEPKPRCRCGERQSWYYTCPEHHN